MDHSDLVKEHFEKEYDYYDELIQKLIPKYNVMHFVAVNAIDFDPQKNIKFLDLGIGTGKTSETLLNGFPNARVHGIDLALKMLEQAKINLNEFGDRITFEESDMIKLNGFEKYDGCIGILSIHHLTDDQKSDLFKKVFTTLNKGGIFVIGDIIKFDTEKGTHEKEQKWKKFLVRGLGEEKGNFWFKNYLEEDIPSSISQQVKWLKEAGFEAECIWEYMNYAVIKAVKN